MNISDSFYAKNNDFTLLHHPCTCTRFRDFKCTFLISLIGLHVLIYEYNGLIKAIKEQTVRNIVLRVEREPTHARI